MPGSDVFPGLKLSGLSREDAHNRVDAEILRLKDHIRALLSVKNSLEPVSSLPNELLSKVFMHCCDFSESGVYTDIRTTSPHKADQAQPEMRLVVSGVSRHWRNVALGHRPLWNLVVNLQKSLHLDYVRVCAERCQHLFVDLAAPADVLLDGCVSGLAQTTTYLKLNSAPTEAMGAVWLQPSPNLQTLKLDYVQVQYNDTEDVYYPKLQTLELTSCKFRWEFVTSLSSTISILDIDTPTYPLTTAACVDLLKSLSVLSDCAFWCCLRPSPPLTPRPNRIRLQQLKRLTLSEPTPCIIQLLQAIEIPKASVKMYLRETESSTQEATELFRVLRTLHADTWDSIHHLQLRNTVTVASYKLSPCHQVAIRQNGGLRLQQPAYKILNFDSLESLWASSLSDEALENLCHITQLRQLTLEGSAAFKSFVEFMDSKACPYGSTILFPALRELILADLDSEEGLKMLYDILASRKVWGFGLQAFALYRCDVVSIGAVARIKDVVDQMEISRKVMDHSLDCRL